jgi:nucleoside phosphorylase
VIGEPNSKPTNVRNLTPIISIHTAIQDEYELTLGALEDIFSTKFNISFNPTYAQSEVITKTGKKVLLRVTSNDGNNGQGSHATTNALRNVDKFSPSVVFMCGVCGGTPDAKENISPGDVIVFNTSVNYERGSIGPDGSVYYDANRVTLERDIEMIIVNAMCSINLQFKGNFTVKMGTVLSGEHATSDLNIDTWEKLSVSNAAIGGT